ncbi:hypothetical protein ACFQ7F_13660 [Streptomyces sp. NPDC056486]|uniref:hypothetical protein n=1 Tax=Streptomyces sp. NPDC056486 TaxID=3345835 RepID=UPI0036834514
MIVSSHPTPEIRATPAEGCDVCGALAKQWDEAGDRDLLIEINNHPHDPPKLSRVAELQREGVALA